MHPRCPHLGVSTNASSTSPTLASAWLHLTLTLRGKAEAAFTLRRGRVDEIGGNLAETPTCAHIAAERAGAPGARARSFVAMREASAGVWPCATKAATRSARSLRARCLGDNSSRGLHGLPRRVPGACWGGVHVFRLTSPLRAVMPR